MEHAPDSVRFVDCQRAVVYRCVCGWATEQVVPTTPACLTHLKAVMAAHLDSPDGRRPTLAGPGPADSPGDKRRALVRKPGPPTIDDRDGGA